MPRIKNLQIDDTITDNDKLLGTEATTGNTKNYKIGDIKKMVLFCAAGFRSALAAKSLVDMGFKNVAHVDGGFDALKNVGMKVIEKEKK